MSIFNRNNHRDEIICILFHSFEYNSTVLNMLPVNSIKKHLKNYYSRDLQKLYRFLIPKGESLIKIKAHDKISSKKRFKYVVADNCIGEIEDVQSFFEKLKQITLDDGRVIVTYYNYLWEPILRLGSNLGLRKKVPNQNWLDNDDISNLLNLSGFEVITRQKRLLIPFHFPLISDLLNKFIAHLPVINNLCLTIYVVAKPKQDKYNDYTVSIVIPARNEAGNVSKIVRKIPSFGKSQEIVFVEGHSSDDTWNKIQEEILKKRKGKIKIKAYKQRGKGKADAVRLGFAKATGEMLMIYDADMTVDPKDLPKFYNSLKFGAGDFANGTRLVYPMEKEAMQTLNKFFNKLFSIIFSWILGQRFKDTLCGTKVITRQNYLKIMKLPKIFGKDPFGDFDLIFGSIKLNLKVVEIPVRYRERTYGSTNISRFRHGVQLARMTWLAFNKFMAW
jgi:hypothetical protein